MINSVLTSLRNNKLEKKLKKKYGLSEAEAKELLRQGRTELASQRRASLKQYCEEQLQHRTPAENCKTDDDYPAIEPSCSFTVAWSKSDTETNSAWESSKGSPTKTTDRIMTPPEQIYPLHRYMHQEDDNKSKTNQESSPKNIEAMLNEQLSPVPEMLLTMRSDEVTEESATTLPLERKLNYGIEETDQVNEPHDSSSHPDEMNKTSDSHSKPSNTPMDFLATPSKKEAPPGPPSLSPKMRDLVKRFSEISDFIPDPSSTPQTAAYTLTPLSSPHSDLPVNDTSSPLGDANDEAHDDVDSVVTREEQLEVEAKDDNEVAHVVKERKVKHSNVPRVIFVRDPPEFEVLPFTDEEGFVIRRERRLAPIERFSL
ncbi:hypothetical protein FisN_26Hh092 [Fistulifera solaris]|uniref:Uncharacterized protein n=1 Tax=Fistulifera solaris TaxID=1519565 RepID=A0A1Z5JY44_FISSO|nr:hypothetical protein FisN_26Hh092 [Fistulifera solaris]|eukprot:GAX18792.1 hypothetical protein FisN_26Hh092 [Fistulifera solaris]